MAHVVESKFTESHLASLQEMRDFGGQAMTVGLKSEVRIGN
jgi:hypothetical protein